MTRAVFLDRDGVLSQDRGYAFKPDDVHMLGGVPEALLELKRRGYLLIVVTNQSGVARGLFTLADVEGYNSELQGQIEKLGGPGFDAIFVCPHHPSGSIPAYAVACLCRKPGTKMIDDAVVRFAIDRSKSFLVGDKDSDIACAIAAGLTGIQINQGKTALHPQAAGVAASLLEALRFIPLAPAFS